EPPADEIGERIAESAVGDIPLQRVELARDKDSAALRQWLIELRNHARFADAGPALDEQELRLARLHAGEGSLQCGDLSGTAIEPLGELKPLGDVVLGEGEWGDLARRGEPSPALVEVAFEPEGALISILRGLFEELHHDVAHRLGHGRIDLDRRG